MNFTKHTTTNWLLTAIFFSLLSVVLLESVAVGDFIVAPKSVADKFRRTPNSLREKLAMDEAMGGAGERIMKGKLMSDPRFKGMEKWQHVHYNPDGTKTVIHFLRDPATGKFLDFKFK